MNPEAFEKECDKDHEEFTKLSDEFADKLMKFLNNSGYPKNVVMNVTGNFFKQLIEESPDPDYLRQWYIRFLNGKE